MDNKKLASLFESLQGSFDSENPGVDHKKRFIYKLQTQRDKNTHRGVKTRAGSIKKMRWAALAAAASIALMVSAAITVFNQPLTSEQRVAEISPEASRTQFYFSGLLRQQVKRLEQQSTLENRQLIEDTFLQLQKLDNDYNRLEEDLISGGNRKLILSAMITNYRTRIDLLQEVLEAIDTLNKEKDEMSTIM